MLLLVSKILNSESNSQLIGSLFVYLQVVVGIKDTEFWKQFTTILAVKVYPLELLLVSKILNSESNSQRAKIDCIINACCCWYQRYWILKAIHNYCIRFRAWTRVVVGIKDTEFWKQFTTAISSIYCSLWLLLVSKILNSESNSQQVIYTNCYPLGCCWYQRYWILKAIHNLEHI